MTISPVGELVGDGRPTLGLIAGSGRLPFELAAAARAAGFRVAAVGHRGATDKRLAAAVDTFEWVRVGQLGLLASSLRERGISQAVLAGALGKASALVNARPDRHARELWTSLRERGDDRVLRRVADWLADQGITVVSPLGLLKGCFAPLGHWAGPPPSPDRLAAAAHGFEISRQLGALDIGQTVVVRERLVVAVEALEGTDRCIRRAGRLLPDTVVVKALKPGQDLRFDLPAVGPGTLRTMAKAKSRLLALEAGVSLLIDRAELQRLAERFGIAVVGFAP